MICIPFSNRPVLIDPADLESDEFDEDVEREVEELLAQLTAAEAAYKAKQMATQTYRHDRFDGIRLSREDAMRIAEYFERQLGGKHSGWTTTIQQSQTSSTCYLTSRKWTFSARTRVSDHPPAPMKEQLATVWSRRTVLARVKEIRREFERQREEGLVTKRKPR